MSELNYQNPADARREMAGDWRRRLFGPSREEVWQQLAREINARHEPREWFKAGRVVAGVGSWQMTLDVLEQENQNLTRLRAPFANPTGFRFRIYRTTV